MINSIPTSWPSFLLKLNARIEEHMFDDNLTVRRLLPLLAMSRSDLHRKLTRSVGMSATRYIRHIRLQRAATLLLKERDWSVYQVALDVGFKSQSYFTKRFREAFGVCPLEWRQGKLAHLC